jgi:hypothetical protein
MLLYEIVLPLKFLTPYPRTNTLFPGKQNAEIKSQKYFNYDAESE